VRVIGLSLHWSTRRPSCLAKRAAEKIRERECKALSRANQTDANRAMTDLARNSKLIGAIGTQLEEFGAMSFETSRRHSGGWVKEAK